MTLTKKMVLGVLGLLLLVFIGTYMITFNHARNYFSTQLQSNAQDTATSLGLSLSQSLREDDKASILAMVQAVFDRGYFSSIVIQDMNKKILVKRTASPQKSATPAWFRGMVKTGNHSGSALVMSGWNQVGTVKVVSNPEYAYQTLWRNALDLMKAYLCFAFIALLVVYAFIQWLLQPLQRLKMQAMAIRHHAFPIETQIPKTLELKEVTLAMNQMVAHIHRIFDGQMQEIEHLNQAAFQDPLTGLANRQFFLQQLNTLLSSEEEFVPGFVIMICLDNLYALYKQGRQKEADAFVVRVAEFCTVYWSICARISGNSFALLVEDKDQASFHEAYEEFKHKLQQLQQSEYPDLEIQLRMGMAAYHWQQSTSALLAEVDKSLENAKKEPFNPREAHQPGMLPFMDANFLEKAINKHAILFYAQEATDGKKVFHKEIFIRISSQQDEAASDQKEESLWTAGYFMPLAEKLELAHCLDWEVLNKAYETLLNQDLPLALNISSDTLINPLNRSLFLEKLSAMPLKIRQHLHIELNESFILKHSMEAKLFLNELKKLHIVLGVDQVGRHFSSFSYLKDLGLDYVKLHATLLQRVYHPEANEDKPSVFFMESLYELAKLLGLTIIATQVEKKEQWEALQALSIRFGQGKYLCPVTKLS